MGLVYCARCKEYIEEDIICSHQCIDPIFITRNVPDRDESEEEE